MSEKDLERVRTCRVVLAFRWHLHVTETGKLRRQNAAEFQQCEEQDGTQLITL